MHLVRFKDGKYGVRRLWFTGWQFLDLNNFHVWRTIGKDSLIPSQYRSSYERVANIKGKFRDNGTRTQRANLAIQTNMWRTLGLLGWVMSMQEGLWAIHKLHDNIDLILFFLFLMPSFWLVYRGYHLEEKVVFIETGWDK